MFQHTLYHLLCCFIKRTEQKNLSLSGAFRSREKENFGNSLTILSYSIGSQFIANIDRITYMHTYANCEAFA